jgi:DNA-binding MarR family transcriptional regulator
MDYYTPESYRAQNSIGYLMHRVTSLVRARIEQQLAPFELSFHQWLSLLWVRDGVATTASDIAKGLGLDPGALARMLEDLETRDWIERTRSKVDRRVVMLALSDSGRAELVLTLPTVTAELNRALGNFTLAEADQLTFLMRKLLSHQEALAQQDGAKGEAANK